MSDPSNEARALCEALGLAPVPVPIGLAVATPLTYPDGDRIGFYVRRVGSGLTVEDDGASIPAYVAAGRDLAMAQVVARRAGIDYDAETTTLSIAVADPEAFGGAVKRLVGFLCRLGHPSLGMKSHRPRLFEGPRSETVA